MTVTAPVIQFAEYGFRYSEAATWALHNLSLDVMEGEILLAIGRSGCGKSTLALALNGAVPHLVEGETAGSLSVAGLSATTARVSDLARHVGMVFQDPEVQLFALTVEDEVAMSLESYGMARAEMRERIAWALEVCGLRGLELSAPAKLSGGQKQRAAIAAVLAREPEILVFDEPTGNLDPVGSRSVYETIRRISDDRGRTIVLVEHDLAPVIDLVDRVIVLEGGEIAFQGTAREVMRELPLLRRSGVKVPAAVQFGLGLEQRGLVRYQATPISMDEALSALETTTGARERLDGAHGTVPVPPQPAGGQTPIVAFRNVTHEYRTGHKGIDDINLAVCPGEFVAVCGMNGAGKTTMLLHIMGLLRPTGGSVLVDGHDTRQRTVAEMARTVGLIFQNPNHQLFKDTVYNEIAFGPRNIGWDPVRIDEGVRRVMDQVGLRGLEERDPESLSIGQRQRVAMASVMVMEPSILLLDEPTTGQDQQTLEPFMELVSQLNRDGMTVLMITHDMDVAMRYASRIVVLNEGRITADGPPDTIFLQEDVLTAARLHLPELLALTKQLNGGQPIYVSSLDEVEQRFVLRPAAPEQTHDLPYSQPR